MPSYFRTANMTLDEIKREVAVLSGEARLRLTVFLKHLKRVESAADRAELSRLNRTIDAGGGITLEQWRKIHLALGSEGL